MDSQDDAFRLTRDALKAKQKSLKKQGRGNRPNKTDAITDEEINILYEKKLLEKETPSWTHFGLTIPYILDLEVWVNIPI